VNDRTAVATLLVEARVEGRLVEPLAHYAELVLAENRRMNLTGARTPAEIVEHLLDSLSVVPFIRSPYVDVGSGAGFPGIPVALAAGVETTLIEATAKKAKFLERALRELGIAGRVVAQRAEVAGRDSSLRERFASGTARAVASAPAVAELVVPLLAVGGEACLQRGEIEEAERTALADAALVLGAELVAEQEVSETRRILIVRKHGPTPLRFPRRTGIPVKRPLCYGPARRMVSRGTSR